MKIGLLVYPECIASGLLAFAELLTVANQRANKVCFDIAWVGLDTDAVTLHVGDGQPILSLAPTVVLSDIVSAKDALDVLVVPGFWTCSQRDVTQALLDKSALVGELANLPANTHLLSYCTGVCLAAEAGKLDKLTATSTWWLAGFLQQRYPLVNWRFNHTCITHFSADDSGGATASGVNGYLPMAQQLIEQYCGEDILRDVVDVMVIPRPEKMQQPFQVINLMELDDPLMRKIYVWVEQQPAAELSLSALSESVNQTERTLSRKVKKATDLSCAQFMRLVKLHQASDMLIYSSLGVTSISHALGFSDDAAFRRSFKKVTTFAPGEYRTLFKR